MVENVSPEFPFLTSISAKVEELLHKLIMASLTSFPLVIMQISSKVER